ncbi:MAG: hypothetical protein AAGI17_01955 [Planctomycetota bacterium]
MADPIAQKIQTAAENPAEVSTDAGRVRQHSIDDQIKAERFAAAQEAKASKSLGIRVGKVRTGPPGGC